MASIRENILDNIVTTLRTITEANGYNNDIGLVTREPHNWNNLKPNEKPSAQVLWTTQEYETETITASGQYVLAFLNVNIRGIVYAKDDLEGALNAFAEDIEQAMSVDETRNNLAEYTIPKLISVFAGEDEYNIFFDFEWTILFNYLYGSP